jgi:hypothetical protein
MLKVALSTITLPLNDIYEIKLEVKFQWLYNLNNPWESIWLDMFHAENS